MKVTKLTYRRTKQVARFEPEVIELEIQLGPKDTVAKAMEQARATVAREFGETVHKVKVTEIPLSMFP